jgi:glycosyltransferase involved in cell wall biosynthesis
MFKSRIGIDARLLAYRKGGIAEYTRQLIVALQGLDPENFYHIFHHRRDTQPHDYATNFQRCSLWTPPHHRLERSALSVELMRHRLHVYHSPDFIPPRHAARFHLITIHDLHFLHYPQFQTADSLRYYRDQIQEAVAHADHIFAQTEGTKHEIIEHLNVSSEKITVHGLGVHPMFQRLPSAAVENALAPYQLPAEYLLFVGTIEPRKNLPNLIAAYALLNQKYPTIPPLVLGGQKGWHSEESFAAIEKYHLQTQVIWFEDVPWEVLPALYNRAKVLVLPSFHEGFGLTAVEAMACGVPVVVSERGSLPEVVGKCGVYINPDEIESIAEGILKVLDDSTLSQTLCQAGPAHAAQYTWTKTAQIVLRVYQQFLN